MDVLTGSVARDSVPALNVMTVCIIPAYSTIEVLLNHGGIFIFLCIDMSF